MKERPEVLPGVTYKIKTENGTFYLTINFLENEPYEVSMRLGKPGSMIRTLLENLSIWWSILLQELPKNKLIKILKKHSFDVTDDNPILYGGEQYRSIIDFVAKKILEKLKEENESK